MQSDLRRWVRLVESQVAHPVTPNALIAAIKTTIEDFLQKGIGRSVRDIGDGHCYDFAEAVFTRLDAHQDYLHGSGPSGLVPLNTEDWEKTEWVIDVTKLRKSGEPVPF